MKIIIAIFFLFVCINIHAQPYAIGKRAINFTDASRANRVINTDVFYPALIAGNNTNIASGTEKFAVIVFGHGFVMPTSAYQWLVDSLVPQGFIVALPNTESSFAPSHENFGRDIAFLCNRIMSLNDSAGNFLINRVLQKSASGGHSMGGGASFLAHNYTTTINAIFNFAAAETTPSAKAAALNINKPSLIFAGSADCIVPDTTQLKLYNNIPYPCKTFINITNALHCQFGNNDATCSLGQLTNGCNTSSITAPIVFTKTMAFLLPFLNYYLKQNCTSINNFNDAYNNTLGIVKQRTCITDPLGCVNTNINNRTVNNKVALMPSCIMVNQPLKILTNQTIKSYTILNALGVAVIKNKIINTNAILINTVNLKTGVYFVKLFYNNTFYTTHKFIIQ
jgi:dienelactone hydrolase